MTVCKAANSVQARSANKYLICAKLHFYENITENVRILIISGSAFHKFVREKKKHKKKNTQW